MTLRAFWSSLKTCFQICICIKKNKVHAQYSEESDEMSEETLSTEGAEVPSHIEEERRGLLTKLAFALPIEQGIMSDFQHLHNLCFVHHDKKESSQLSSQLTLEQDDEAEAAALLDELCFGGGSQLSNPSQANPARWVEISYGRRRSNLMDCLKELFKRQAQLR